MHTPEESARLSFLTDAAYALLLNAPETSRHLMLQCNALSSETESSTAGAQTRKSCGACGTLMILGWEGTLQVEARRRKRKRSEDGNTNKAPSTMVYECSTCGVKTHISRNPPPKRITHRQTIDLASRRSHAIPSSEQKSITAVDSRSDKTTKKRAKSKKPGYLQAILASKQATESRSGFDLLDFMKQA